MFPYSSTISSGILTGITAAGFFLLCCQNPTDKSGPAVTLPGADSIAAEDSPAYRLNQLGDAATQSGDYIAAIAYFQQSIDSAAATADSFAYYDSRLDLACVHDRLSELPKAIEIAEPVLAAFIRSGDSSRIGRAYTTLAAFYGRAGIPDKSLALGRNGFNILKAHGSLIERCAAYNQMAFTYSDAGRYTEALPLLDSATQLMLASGVSDQLTSMYLNLGDCHRRLGHVAEARKYLLDAEHLADSLGQTHVRAVVFKRLSQLEESAGNFAQALDYFQKSATLKDTIFTREKARNLQDLELHYQTREKEKEIQLLQANHALEKARRNSSLVLLAFVLGISGVWLYRWREKLRRSQQQLDKNRSDLETYVRVLMEKNARLAVLERDIEQPSNARHSTEPEEMSGAGLLNRNILTDTDWTAFKDYFERSHPGYILRLRRTFPDLTDAEERLFLLLKMNLSSKEAAAMQGISLDSIKKNRYRLRKRLGLEHEEGLEQFVRTF